MKNETSYSFTGRDWDKETGLYYHRGRYRDPIDGNFINKDPVGFKGGLNLYTYVLNNPINLTDKYGTTIDLKNAGELVAVLERIKRTTVGRWLAHVLEDSTETYYIVLMPSGTRDAAATLGNITLRIQGTLTICGCNWSFEGVLKSFEDIYDFNRSTHKSRLGELSTTIGNYLPGQFIYNPYSWR